VGEAPEERRGAVPDAAAVLQAEVVELVSAHAQQPKQAQTYTKQAGFTGGGEAARRDNDPARG